MYIENMLKNYKCALTQKLFSRDFLDVHKEGERTNNTEIQKEAEIP